METEANYVLFVIRQTQCLTNNNSRLSSKLQRDRWQTDRPHVGVEQSWPVQL